MYDFVDTQPTENKKQGLSLQTIFNQINLDEHLTDDDGSFMTLAVNGRNDFSHRINSIAVPGGDGEVEQDDPPLNPKTIVVEYKLKANSNELLREKFNQLNGLLKGSKVELRFTDEDALFYTTPRINSVPDERSNDLVGTIEFYCSDPYKYGPEQTVNFSSDTSVIENEGTAEAKPITELTVKEPVTFAMISNGDEYNLVGQPAEDDVQIIDSRELISSENGDMTGWNSSGTEVDSISGAISDGTLTHDGTGIIASNYGSPVSGRDGYGPANIKELSEALEDFEIQTIIDTRTDDVSENFRVEVYGFDEGMNMLGKIGISDVNRSFHERNGLGRIGEYVNSYTRYLIHSDNFRFRHSGGTMTFYIKWKREGTRSEMNIYRVVNGELRNWVRRRYKHTSDDWLGKLKYIQVYIRTYRDRPTPVLARINRLDVYKLIQLTEDQTPYFAYAGDKIIFDHENRDVLLNGEAIAKQIGGDFFTLKEGENTLALMPEGAFEAQLRYRPRYR